MARQRRSTVIENDTANIDTAALSTAHAAAGEIGARSLIVADQIGYDIPYNRERVVQEARFYMAESAEAMLEAGKRLIMLKENEPHGEFEAIVERQLGLVPRTAQVMMQAAAKFLLNPALEGKAQALALLGKTKLFELVTEPDDSLIALTEGGTLAGLKLDEIDRMTSRELKAALRASRDDAESQARLLAEKNAKLDELETKLSKKKPAKVKPEYRFKELTEALWSASNDVAATIDAHLRAAINDVTNTADAPEELALLPGQVLTRAMQALIAIQNEFGIEVDLESQVVPAWLAGADDKTPEA